MKYKQIRKSLGDRTVGTCGCPEEDCSVVEEAKLIGMEKPLVVKKLLRCIICGAMYLSEEDK